MHIVLHALHGNTERLCSRKEGDFANSPLHSLRWSVTHSRKLDIGFLCSVLLLFLIAQFSYWPHMASHFTSLRLRAAGGVVKHGIITYFNAACARMNPTDEEIGLAEVASEELRVLQVLQPELSVKVADEWVELQLRDLD